jgi:hypothetical protein
MGSVAIGDEILRGVKIFAAKRGVTPDAQAEEWLRESLARHADDRALRKQFADIAAMSPESEDRTDTLDDLREARNP